MNNSEAGSADGQYSPDGSSSPAIDLAKRALRDQLVTARGRLGVAEIGRRARALSEQVLALPEVRRAASVAAYVSVGREPGTGLLLESLADRGVRVLLPVLLPDFDLDWAPYTGAGELHTARFGLLEPSAEPTGPESVALADVVLVPGLAVDASGHRLGRGGGSYDRALARVPTDAFTCVLLNDDEVLDRLPVDAHDRRVDAVATERRVVRF